MDMLTHKRRGRRISSRYTAAEMGRVCRLEDEWGKFVVDSKSFRDSVLEIRKKLNSDGKPIPELLKEPGHHCTIHRNDTDYGPWDEPLDQLCDLCGVDKGYDLAYSPRYRIERHVLFSEPVGNLFHPLIRCETDPSPVPHITRICVLPPSKVLSRNELNWLLSDLELLIIERMPAYPISPTESRELFSDLKGANASDYKKRVEEGVRKRIISDPITDAHTLVELIEILRDEQGLLFKEIAYVLDMSEGAVRKRYIRATDMPPRVSVWIPPSPRRRQPHNKAK